MHEASTLVGVSEATLRRWAEAGDVEAFVTPGGHRRFTRAAILDLLPHPGRPHRTLRELGGTPERMARQYRRDLGGQAAERWLPDLDEGELEAFREPGRRILTAVLGYLDAPTDAEAAPFLASATAAATEYGRLASGVGLSAVETTEAFLRFRSPFLAELAAIARRRRLDAAEAIGMLVAVATALDHVLVALLRGREASASPDASCAPLAAEGA